MTKTGKSDFLNSPDALSLSKCAGADLWNFTGEQQRRKLIKSDYEIPAFAGMTKTV